MVDSSVLLLLINKSERNAPGRMTSKIFEYMASGRPTLLIGPEVSDPADLLNETKAGFVVDPDNLEKMKGTIFELFQDHKGDRLNVEMSGVQRFSRPQLAEALDRHLTKIME